MSYLNIIVAAAAVVASTAVLAQNTLVPARAASDWAPVDAAWNAAWEDHLDSGHRVPFAPPAMTDIPDGELGEQVRDGMQAFLYPSQYAREYVGNALSCSNCHLDAGRRAGAAPMWGAYPIYPKYRGKNKQVNTMEMRVQGCFRYSMNGTPPPADSEVMKSLLAYFAWLSKGAPVGAKLKGAGFGKLPAPEQAPDAKRGAIVYQDYCVACHGSDGEGLRRNDAAGYLFPPLWGPDSYNWGAGMHKPSSAAAFIKKNMPFGLTTLLSDQQAWDVAMFINSHERPQDPRFTDDVEETRAMYHGSKYNTYGTEFDGKLLGANAYPSGRAPAAKEDSSDH